MYIELPATENWWHRLTVKQLGDKGEKRKKKGGKRIKKRQRKKQKKK